MFYVHSNGFMRCCQMGQSSERRYQVSHLMFVVPSVVVARSANRSHGARYGVYLPSSLVVSKTSFVAGINMSVTEEP
jgi:hypothetical protein